MCMCVFSLIIFINLLPQKHTHSYTKYVVCVSICVFILLERKLLNDTTTTTQSDKTDIKKEAK